MAGSDVIIFDCGLSEKHKAELTHLLSRYEASVRFLLLNSLMDRHGVCVDNSMPLASYARLFVCDLEEYDKVIYMDCDAVLNGSLQKVWEMDLADNFVAGVLDSLNPEEKACIGLKQEDDYINAGFLLLNTKLMRQEHWMDLVLKTINSYNGSVPKHDQGVINILAKERKVLLPPKYNAMLFYIFNKAKDMYPLFRMNAVYSEAEFAEASSNPVFIHSVNFYDYRIWDKKNKHPYREYYKQCAIDAGVDPDSFFTDVKRNIPMEIARFFISRDYVKAFVLIRKFFWAMREH